MNNKNMTIVVSSLPLLASLVFTGCAGDHDRTTGRVLDDRRISGKVRAELNHSAVYKFPHVNVATYNGAVQLNGFVYKDEQKAEAVELAKRVPGVTEVINNISLAPTAVGDAGKHASMGASSGGDTNSAVPRVPVSSQNQ